MNHFSPRFSTPLRTLAALIVCFLVLITVLYAIPTKAHYNSPDNIRWYATVAHAIASHGILNVWTPYPPLFACIVYPVFGIMKCADAVVLWNLFNAAFVAGICLLVYLMSRRFASTDASLLAAAGCLLINCALTSKIFVGILIDQFDYVPIFLMLLSLHLLLERKVIPSAFFCAAGTLTKLFPALVLPCALCILGGSDRKRYLYSFLAFSAGIAAPFFFSNTDIFLSMAWFNSSRPPWETIFSFPRMLMPQIPQEPLLTARFYARPNFYNFLFYFQAGFVVLFAFLFRKKIAGGRAAAVSGLLCSLLLFLLFSKGFSSYFVLWLFPLFFLLYKPVSAFLLAAVLLCIGNMEFVKGFSFASVCLRHAVLALLLFNLLRGLSSSEQPHASPVGTS
jgi:hypothetical protein